MDVKPFYKLDIKNFTLTLKLNLSIKFFHFPKDCKVAKLKPFYKKGTKTDPKNFRPISHFPIVSKIIEKVIHDQTMNYLTENSILYRHQSGFHRTTQQTDTQMSALRFSDPSINWFQSYLSNRSFQVNV